MFLTFESRSFPATSHNLKAMKKYTHAWLAMMALKRLSYAEMNSIERAVADILLIWLNNHRDSVINRAWYPGTIICNTDTSHGLKYSPVGSCATYRNLPENSRLKQICGALIPNTVVKGHLPDGSESITQSIVDNFKMQESEDKQLLDKPHRHPHCHT